ncbi:MAG: thioredoxin domain-containing protein [Planctomycetota bacterium]|nr:MAG: thioredoxin domain-containing protein [Planctomycetota bacterium]
MEERRKLPPDGGPDFNRLVFEKSPYLLQHAGNPVDWFPWGDEAFARARAEDKPVFLSIGYSTCHWCHVMEHESFEADDVAALLNRDFICVKVDREERPDVDAVYMSVCQAMTGGGGWPLTILMTPDRRPFFAATYIPREDRFGRAGMLRVLPQIAEVWRTRRGEVENVARQITEQIASRDAAPDAGDIDTETLALGFRQLAGRFDAERGGFGDAPKFPTPHHLTFLLRWWKRSGDAAALNFVERTLSAMATGGIYDHLGFGFHRYSTDADWLVPHFEKMLYDQALLVIAYAEGHQATGKPEYARTVREVMTYVLRDMTSPEGAFYSAEDADSEGVEGKFYLWTAEEVRAALGEDDARVAAAIWNLRPDGNFTNPHTPPRTNILHLARPLSAVAAELKTPEDELRRRAERIRNRLFETRRERIPPHKDDKVLTDWNGLMIAAASIASRAFDEPRYADAARRAADFVLTRLRREDGRLLKRYREGDAGLPAHLDDYAYLIWGLIELYETTFDPRYLEAAIELQRVQTAQFGDAEHGGFFLTAADGEKLIARPKELYDGALPSGNSVSALNLLRLARLTGDPALEALASRTVTVFAGTARHAPMAFTQFLCAADFALGPAYEVVIAGTPDAADTRAMLGALNRRFHPNVVVLLRPDAPDAPPITRLAPFTAAQKPIDGKATAYVCRNFACAAPTTDVREMLSGIDR